MVQYCSVWKCFQRYEKGISFHGFPTDETLKKKWVVAIKRNNFLPTKSSKVCSKHFTADDYECSGWSSKRILKSDAVPSIFDFHLKNEPQQPQPFSDVVLVSDTDDVGDTFEIKIEHIEYDPLKDQPPQKVRKPGQSYIIEEDPRKLLHVAQKVINEKNRKLRLQRLRIASMAKRISKLEELLKLSKEKYAASETTR